MNKYIIPIFDSESYQIWIEKISAKSLDQCKDKIISKIADDFEIDELSEFDSSEYEEFVEKACDYNLIIGDIEDIETL